MEHCGDDIQEFGFYRHHVLPWFRCAVRITHGFIVGVHEGFALRLFDL